MKLTPWMLSLTGFCIVIALTGGFVLKQMRADNEIPAELQQVPVRFEPTDMVPVALSDILPGTRIEANYLTDAAILSSKVRKHRDTVRSGQALVGRIAKQKISAATPIRLSMFYPVNRKPDVRIPPGQRLVSVRIENQSGFLNGLIQSGSYVDVFASVSPSAATDSNVVQLFEGVRVYEVFSASGGAGGEDEAILELNSEQQKIMLLAKERGRISLTYNPEGPGTAGIASDSEAAKQLNGEQTFASPWLATTEKATPPTKPTFVTEQFRDGVRSVTSYNADGVQNQTQSIQPETIPPTKANVLQPQSPALSAGTKFPGH